MHDFVMNGDIGALLLEQAPMAIAVFDREMHYLACSRRWFSDYELPGTNIIGKSHYEVFPEINSRLREIHAKVLAGEVLSGEVEPFERGDGSIAWVQWRMVPWRTGGDEIGGAILFTEVVTDLVRAQQQALEVNTEFNLLIDSAIHHAICLLDTEGKVRIWNVGAERLYGWGATEVLGKPYDILFEDADREAGLPARQLAEALRTGSFHGRSWRLGKGGRRFLVEANISSINDYYGKHIGFGQVVRDITEENLRAQQIEASEAQLRSILETVPDAMVTIDERGRVESFSKAAERLFGYRADEVIGQNVAMLMPADEAERHDGYLARYHATGERRIIGFQRRVMGQRKDGSIFPHELFVSEAYGGGRRFYTGFLRDLTEREAAQASLHELQAELIHISRVSAVGTMATALAHELNQPLTSIANYVQSSAIMIANGETQMLALVHEALIEAGNEALRAGAIVQRLREFIVRGDPERTLVSLNDLAREACALGAIGGGMRGISCDIAIAPDLPEVLVDRVQVHQVLLNLIRNAFEAMTEGGKIFIKARREDLLICVSVEDNGPGIPAGTEETLFEPFVTSKTSGMGMGLAICRTIVEAHGGRLWCETTPEGGAAFRFTLPIAETDHD